MGPPWRPAKSTKCYGGLMILLQALKKYIPGGCRGKRIINRSIGGLQGVKTVKGASIGPTITVRTYWMPQWWPGLRTLRSSGSHKYCWDPVDDLLPHATPWNFFWNPERGSSLGPNYNNLDSLKASMAALFVDMIISPGARRIVRSASFTTTLEYSMLPKHRVASSIIFSSSSMYYFHVIQKNQVDKFIFEWVREKLFSCGFNCVDPVYKMVQDFSYIQYEKSQNKRKLCNLVQGVKVVNEKHNPGKKL